jgi:hypothetical protein
MTNHGWFSNYFREEIESSIPKHHICTMSKGNSTCCPGKGISRIQVFKITVNNYCQHQQVIYVLLVNVFKASFIRMTTSQGLKFFDVSNVT